MNSIMEKRHESRKDGSKCRRKGEGTNYDLEGRLIDFAVSAIELVEALAPSKAGNHVAGQLVRAGTSPAPNYGEAQSAESRKDFIHKMKLVLKELRETRVWRLIIHRKELMKDLHLLKTVLSECEELIRIFRAGIKTAALNALE